ncbi:MAG TPA: aspartate 1-decarboxylase, partial [Candidatus Dormibacteraeota bacterium]|nr:aspartate 1-decarboxylase [Candidatus Dormibacteraeota bacterium]
MHRVLMKSKIHRATVTRADPDYEGSCGIDPALMRAADILPGEQLHVVNVTNGSRAVTYAIEGAAGEISLNGAMALVGGAGDVVILITYAHVAQDELAG